jgi:hypothetical protein
MDMRAALSAVAYLNMILVADSNRKSPALFLNTLRKARLIA